MCLACLLEQEKHTDEMDHTDKKFLTVFCWTDWETVISPCEVISVLYNSSLVSVFTGRGCVNDIETKTG
jgi:hypothetical protein